MTKEEIRECLNRAIRKSPSQRYIRKVSLFGSHVRGEAKPGSDIDLLVDIDESIGAFEFIAIERYLSEQLGTKVDLVEPEALSKYFRDDVLKEAETIYTA